MKDTIETLITDEQLNKEYNSLKTGMSKYLKPQYQGKF